MIPPSLQPSQRLTHLPAQKAVRCPVETLARRLEDRTSVKVLVDLSGMDVRSSAQQGVTENVSARGARVVTGKPWQPNDRVNIRSLRGSLRSRGRVVYCQPLPAGAYAIGLELFVTIGDWTSPSHSAGKPA